MQTDAPHAEFRISRVAVHWFNLTMLDVGQLRKVGLLPFGFHGLNLTQRPESKQSENRD
jgi:hypothetical protein